MNLNLLYLRSWTIAGLALAGAFCGFAQQTNRVNPKGFSAFQIINDRNIFDPNRRPRMQQTHSTSRAQQIVNSFTLVGTMSYSNLVLAFFEGTSADYRKSVGPNGKIAGYTATEIAQDSVKLSSGTNQVVLKVGMQMRRSEDGTWSASEPSESSYSFNGNNQNSERNERRSDSRQSDFRTSNSSENQGNMAPQNQGQAGLQPDFGAAIPAQAMGAVDTNDPVARLMLRRLQEEGGAAAVPNDNSPPENSPAENQDANPSEISSGTKTNLNAQPERNQNRN